MRQLAADIVWVQAGTNEYYLDPGAHYFPFGMLPWYVTHTRGIRLESAGGTIVATPMNHGITERSVLALGDYTGLMYYTPGVSFAKARSLPPAGVRPLIDSQEILEHPASCAAEQAIAREDVRFVVVYRTTGPGAAADLAGFQGHPARYRRVFENRSVVIYAPQAGPCAS